MRKISIQVVTFVFYLVSFSQCFAQGPAGDRVALVIGNSSYINSPLKNPVNDATDISTALTQLSFDTELLIDGDQQAINAAIKRFSERAKNAKLRVFYYAGHGISANDTNYLIPVNSALESEDDLDLEAVDTGVVLKRLQNAGRGTNLLILDACRNNPLPAASRSSSRGLSRMKSPVGSLILYATAPGEVAFDGAGRNGTFTKNLLASLQAEGVHLNDIAMDVRVAVMKETKNKQVPWSESSLTERIYLKGKPLSSEQVETPAVAVNKPNDTVVALSNNASYEGDIVSAYRAAADAGDNVAQHRLGYLFSVGRYVDKNAELAADWYELAYENGNTDAAVNLGYLLYAGEGIGRDLERARKLFQFASKARIPEGMSNLAALYQNGEGVSQNYQESIRLFRESFELGNVEAAVGVADHYSYGLGVQKDDVEAVKWYEKAAELGSAKAQSELGYHYLEGIGLSKNEQKAFEYFQRSALQNHGPGLFNLAEMYELGLATDQSVATAIVLYKKAASQGVFEANEVLTRLEGGN